jgi:hypothetical protein
MHLVPLTGTKAPSRYAEMASPTLTVAETKLLYRSTGLVSRNPHHRNSLESDKDATIGVREEYGSDGGYDEDEPTTEDLSSLRRVADALPWSAYLVALVEMCERFTYYGLSGPFQNYISNEYNDPANPGALGERQRHMHPL